MERDSNGKFVHGHKQIGGFYKGYKPSPESIEKMRISNKGKHHSPSTEFKKGSKINLGRKRPDISSPNSPTKSVEARAKMREKALQRPPMSEATRKKIGLAAKGRPSSMGMLGKKHTPETIQKIKHPHHKWWGFSTSSNS